MTFNKRTIYYNLLLSEDTIDLELECFTYADNEKSLGDYLLSELYLAITNTKGLK